MLETRGQTAIHRVRLSRPVTRALTDGVVRPDRSFFDYGCGRGTDVVGLRDMGVPASGWDPVHAADAEKSPANVVNLGYVVNVIEDPNERRETLLEAWRLSTTVLVVAARLDWDVDPTQAIAFNDGLITSRGTFQKFFTQEELKRWIKDTLGAEPDAAGPGIFYVFREAGEREQFLASVARGVRRERTPPIPAVTFESHREVLEQLLQFLVEHGRPPSPGELVGEESVVQQLGSINRAVRLLARVADPHLWEQTAMQRQRDLLVYLALGSFRRRPKFSVLPRDLQTDIKAFLGSYAAGARLGRDLLFAAGQQEAVSQECVQASVGKLTPEALYVHVSALEQLPVLLRVYEGCARTLVGEVPSATIIKLRRDKPKVSYLCYPDFDVDAHPSLSESFIVDLRELRTHQRRYSDSPNPPILHRKECFVPPEYPQYETFADLTRAEEAAGLLADAASIGTRNAWTARLQSRKLIVREHVLLSDEH